MATINLTMVGTQYNLSGAGDPYTIVFPTGENKAFPTGVRNISSGMLTVTMQAAAGQGFWNTSSQSADNTVQVEIWPGRSFMVVFFTGKGWTNYLTQSSTDAMLLQSVKAGYGGGQQAALIPFDIPGSPLFESVPFDTVPFTSLGCTFTPATNTFTFDDWGIWQLTFAINLQGFIGSQSGRVFDVRLYNVTDSELTPGIAIGVGRNQEDTYVSSIGMFAITETDIGKVFRVEIGGGDAITGGEMTSDIYLQHVSEWKAVIA